ncbi:MAG: hypothetical protein Q9200_002734 [Gallowayella weberi]
MAPLMIIDGSTKYNLRIFSLRLPGMPGGRVYVINSPELAMAVQKQPQKLSAWFIEATFAIGMAGLSKGAAAALMDNVHGDTGQRSLFMEGILSTHKGLQPGEDLDTLIIKAALEFVGSMDKLAYANGQTVRFWDWISMNFMAATAHSMYGQRNPFHDEAIRRSFL